MMMRQSLLSLYACGKINGAVIDSSSKFTSVSTIEEGYFVPEGYIKILFGGEAMTDLISEKFAKDTFNVLPDAWRDQGADLTILDDSFLEFERRNFARKIKHALISQNSRF